MDDGRIQNRYSRNIDNRLKTYITENPRLKCHDSFQADSLAHAEEIERVLIDTTSEYRTHEKNGASTAMRFLKFGEKYPVSMQNELMMNGLKSNLVLNSMEHWRLYFDKSISMSKTFYTISIMTSRMMLRL